MDTRNERTTVILAVGLILENADEIRVYDNPSCIRRKNLNEVRPAAGVIDTIGFANDARWGNFAIDVGLTELLSAATRAFARAALTLYVWMNF